MRSGRHFERPRPNPFRALGGAFSYFSILPCGNAARQGAPIAGTLLALPLVGAVIGLIAGATGWLASIWFPAPFGALFAFAMLIFTSGAIHFDGFLDSCDALFASLPPEERRIILKDPRCGSFAIAGASIIVPLWIAAIAAFPPGRWWEVLAFAGALGRWGAILNGARIPYADGGSATGAFQRPLRRLALACWGIILGAAAVYLLKPAIGLVLLVAGVGLLLGEWARTRLDDVLSGDVYGALAVILEIITLLGFIALR